MGPSPMCEEINAGEYLGCTMQWPTLTGECFGTGKLRFGRSNLWHEYYLFLDLGTPWQGTTTLINAPEESPVSRKIISSMNPRALTTAMWAVLDAQRELPFPFPFAAVPHRLGGCGLPRGGRPARHAPPPPPLGASGSLASVPKLQIAGG